MAKRFFTTTFVSSSIFGFIVGASLMFLFAIPNPYNLTNTTQQLIVMSNSYNLNNTAQQQENPIHICSKSNWLNGLLEAHKKHPFAYWTANNYTEKHYQYLAHSTDTFSDNIILINEENEMNLTQILNYFRKLSLGSIYIHRVNHVMDMEICGRFIELVNNAFPIWFKRTIDYENFHVYSSFNWKCGCMIQKGNEKDDIINSLFTHPKQKSFGFYATAFATDTDKIRKHSYHHFYSKYLNSNAMINSDSCFLEIGLGCNMNYGPGASAKIWPKLGYKNVHFIEYDSKCVAQYDDVINKSNFTVHIGDQSDVLFLEKIKYNFFDKLGCEIIIDDGGHWNYQIIISFNALWPILNPNGYYFIEDMGESVYHGVRNEPYLDSQPIKKMGDEKPGTAQYFIKKMLKNLFCQTNANYGTNAWSCLDIKAIECKLNLCLFIKQPNLLEK